MDQESSTDRFMSMMDSPKGVVRDGIEQVGSMPAEAAREVVEGMHEGGIDFVTMLPESEFLTAQHAIMKDKRFQAVPVSNEGSGVCIAAGAWAGGKKPAIMMGAAGFTVSAYALAGVCIRHEMPCLLLVTSRELGDQNWIFKIWNAHTLEPFLKALTFPYVKVNRIVDVRRTVRDAARTTMAWMKPVAVILTDEVVL